MTIIVRKAEIVLVIGRKNVLRAATIFPSTFASCLWTIHKLNGKMEIKYHIFFLCEVSCIIWANILSKEILFLKMMVKKYFLFHFFVTFQTRGNLNLSSSLTCGLNAT